MDEESAAEKSTDKTKIPSASTGSITAILRILDNWRETWQGQRRMSV